MNAQTHTATAVKFEAAEKFDQFFVTKGCVKVEDTRHSGALRFRRITPQNWELSVDCGERYHTIKNFVVSDTATVDDVWCAVMMPSGRRAA
jgi:hypothetical protein